jgi:HK97 family phage major capsid protein
MADQGHQSDAMIERLERELEERNAFIQGTVGAAQDRGGDISDNETELIKSAKTRVDTIRQQLEMLWDTRQTTVAARERVRETYGEMERLRHYVDQGPVEYRSAGAYILDVYTANTGDRQAKERLEMFYRAAAHQKTSDNLGVIPNPIVGEVLQFIDAARPLVTFCGPKDMPSSTWYRPTVTQHTSVAKQGTAGAADDEKAELVSQKMLITRLTANAVTYGGYVNVSRQNIDFSTPQMLDIIISDLAAQYAVATEAAFGAALIATANEVELAPVATGTNPTAVELTASLWSAVAAVYAAMKGQGRVALAVSPGKLGAWGAMFAPVYPSNAQSMGFNANDFGQGVIGTISGIPVIMSSGIAGAATDFGVVFNTAAIECYEQRVGALQAVEPSVLGVQVAYAGYFTPLVVAAGGIQRITNET